MPSLIPPKNGRLEDHLSHLRCFQVQAEMLNISIIATSTGGFKSREASRGWSIGFQKWQQSGLKSCVFQFFFLWKKHLVNNMLYHVLILPLLSLFLCMESIPFGTNMLLDSHQVADTRWATEPGRCCLGGLMEQLPMGIIDAKPPKRRSFSSKC